MATDAPRSPSECIASAGAAAIELFELVRREWPASGGRRVDEAVRAHAASLLEQVAALPRERHAEAITGIVAALLHSCVACQEQMLLRSPLGRHGL
jgi:hypothetical protein